MALLLSPATQRGGLAAGRGRVRYRSAACAPGAEKPAGRRLIWNNGNVTVPMDPPPPPPPPSSGGAPPPYGAAPPPGYQAYSPSPVDGHERAGFWQRLGGYLLDGLLYGLLIVAFAIPGGYLIGSAFNNCVSVGDKIVCPAGEPNGVQIGLGGLLIAVGFIVVIVLYVRSLGTTGQTWGRKIAGVKVVGETTGEPIGIGKALGRQLFASFISSQIFSLGYLWMLWDEKNQTWHDKIVGSVVIKV